MRKFLFAFTVLTWAAGLPLAFAATGTAVIHGTTEGSKVSGQATFTEVPEGLAVSVELEGVPPGKHGFHIHENGSCEDAGKAAGAHYNPDNAPHGLIFKDGVGHVHAGDLGNLTIGESGAGKFKTLVPGLKLSGDQRNVSGKSVILHEKEDDFSQPAGNAGARIGCGVIEVK